MAEFNSALNVRKIFNCAPEHFLREALLCRHLITYTTGGTSEPAPENYTQLLQLNLSNKWYRNGCFRHPGAGIFTTELFSPEPDEIQAFYQFHHAGEWMTRLENRRTISHDGGLTWSVPESLPGELNNLWIGKGIVLSSGRWLIPFSCAEPVVFPVPKNTSSFPVMQWVERNFRCRCGVLISDDRGCIFRKSPLISSSDPHLIEPRIIEISDSRILMLIRSLNDSCLFCSYSEDGGEHWNDAVATDIPNPSAKILLLRASDGTIILIHNPVKSRRERLEVWLGKGKLHSWHHKIIIGKDSRRNMNYPDGELSPDGKLRLIWENARSIYYTELQL